MRDGVPFVVGIDEAGRGPLAGPVVAAAVILDPERIPDGLDDSKRLTARKRAELFDIILQTALASGIASVAAPAIDATDILKAALEAMRRATCGLSILPGHALIDGREGWLHSTDLLSPLGHRLVVERRGGRWLIAALVAGD